MTWQTDLLAAIGAPTTGPGGQANVQALNAWAQSEGNSPSYNNWLSVSGRYPGAGKCIAQCGGTSPIYTYDTEADGVAATASFMKGSYYTGIIKAFQTNNGNVPPIFTAINQSKWCSGCQNGEYPVDLYKLVGGAASATKGVGSLVPGGGSASLGNLSTTSTCTGGIKIAGATLLDGCQLQEIGGVLLMVSGALVLIVGLGLVLADVGLRKSAPAIVGAIAGRSASKTRMNEREHTAGLKTQDREHASATRRSTSFNSDADRQRFRDEGYPGDS